MPINVAWDNAEKTILLVSVKAYWDWSEFADARAVIRRLLDEVQHMVGIIVHIPPSVELPQNMLEEMREQARLRHPKVKVVVITSESSVIQTLYGILREIYPRLTDNMVYTTTLTRARHIIAESLGRGDA